MPCVCEARHGQVHCRAREYRSRRDCTVAQTAQAALRWTWAVFLWWRTAIRRRTNRAARRATRPATGYHITGVSRRLDHDVVDRCHELAAFHHGLPWRRLRRGAGIAGRLARRRFARHSGGFAAGNTGLAGAGGGLAVCATQFTPTAWLVLVTLLAGLAVLPLAMAPVRVGLTLTVAAALSWLATGLAGAERRLMLIGGLSVLTLVLYRFAQQSIPAVWMLSDVTRRWTRTTGRHRSGQALGGRSQFCGTRYPGRDVRLLRAVG